MIRPLGGSDSVFSHTTFLNFFLWSEKGKEDMKACFKGSKFTFSEKNSHGTEFQL